ncbi:unnamed protein product [Acanthocheilonema viteae]|uniref:Uncharacterized protein n=1 Tax=Acanthocheilonema viteae TaxID=6277 RepID=A0A498S644_ACAVI|nr:unnamed protein product [Acanthocheilonema viteae]
MWNYVEAKRLTTLTNSRVENLVSTRPKGHICCCCPMILTCCVAVLPLQTATVGMPPILPPASIMEPIPIPLPISSPRPVIMPVLHSLLTLPSQPMPLPRPVAVPTLPIPISRCFMLCLLQLVAPQPYAADLVARNEQLP